MPTTATSDIKSVQSKLSLLEDDLSRLRNEVEQLSASRAIPCEPLFAANDPAVLEGQRLAVEMFGVPADVQIEQNPEDDDQQYLVFVVHASGEPRELANKRLEWHRQLDFVTDGRSRSIRLSLVPI